MVVLDNRTLVIVLILIIALLTFLMFISQISRRKAKGSMYWPLGFSLIGVAFVLIYLQGQLPNEVTFLISNFVLLLGYIVLTTGVALFFEAKVKIKFYIGLVSSYWATFLYWFYIDFNTSMRIVAISALLSLLMWDTAWTIYTRKPENYKGIYNFSALTFAFMTFYFLYRGFTTLSMAYIPSLFIKDLSVSISFIVLILGVTSIAMGLIIMNSTNMEIELEKNVALLEAEIDAREMIEMQLKDSNQKLSELSIKDSLTGLFNRRYMIDEFEKEIARAKRNYEVFTLVIIDLDRFKMINDTFGHTVGDEVLISIAEMLNKMTREVDVVGRYGGEEFIILLPNTRHRAAYQLMNRIRKDIQHTEWNYPELLTTFSAGLIEINESNSNVDPKKLISYADEALYSAKNAGRNRVEIYLET